MPRSSLKRSLGELAGLSGLGGRCWSVIWLSMRGCWEAEHAWVIRGKAEDRVGPSKVQQEPVNVLTYFWGFLKIVMAMCSALQFVELSQRIPEES